MRRENRREQGFTLLELMICVAIIGIMASIAVPAFRNYQLNAKRAEAFANLGALAKAEKSYYAEFGLFPEVDAEPMGAGLGPDQSPHESASVATAFAVVGWSPEGKVYYSYDVITGANGSCGSCVDGCFTATAYSDLDGDGAAGLVMYAQPDTDGNFCNVGLIDTISPPIKNGARVLSQVVRIEPFSGGGTTVDDY